MSPIFECHFRHTCLLRQRDISRREFFQQAGWRRHWSYASYSIAKGLCKGGSTEHSWALSPLPLRRVTEIKIDKWWCYVSCSNCGKKLQHTASSFTCVPCNNTSVVGVLRRNWWRVVCLLRWVMTKLHNMRAYEDGHLLSILCVDYLFIQSHSSNLAQAGDGVNPEETEAPPFVKDMEGKTYKLQVRVSSYNFTANHQTFTISHILSEGATSWIRWQRGWQWR